MSREIAKIDISQTNIISHKAKIIAAAVIGTALEFYDFMLFVSLAPQISSLFFPSDNETLSLIAGLGAYAIGFVMRPVGGILFGYVGDFYGRKRALVFSIMLIACPTIIIGLLPTYNDIGPIAPICLIICRLLQGFCTGGEFNGAALLVIENIGKSSSGLGGGIVIAATALGALLGSLVSLLVIQDFMPEWGWRIAFLFGGVIGVVGFYIRKKIKDDYPVELSTLPRSLPIIVAFKKNPSSIISTICITAFGTSLYDFSTAYFSIFSAKFKVWPLNDSIILMCCGALVYIILTPFMGYLGDRFGAARVMRLSAILTFFLAYPVILLLVMAHSFLEVLAAQLVFIILVSLFEGPMSSFIVKLFPKSVRYSGFAFGYCMGIAIFGGPTTVISTAFVEYFDNPIIPVGYIMFGAILGYIGISIGKPAYQIEE